MGNPRFFDVIIAGGGPGGAAAAKKCAESGLKTLLVEKKTLPRDKVCSGMIMGDWSVRIIRDEFGEIPASVFVNPPALSGHRLHVAGANVQSLEWHTLLAWRKDLDFWLVQRAGESGVVIEEGVRLVRAVPEDGGIRIVIRSKQKREELKTRFLIGADGATSVVRRAIFPGLKVRYSGPVRECYRGSLDLEREYIHWFFPKGLLRPRFNVNHKDDVFLIEGAGIRELSAEIRETLLPYGFNPESKPIWKDGCAIALLHEPLLSGTFEPARGNTLLVGDAAGLIFPITFEGIGSALKSGMLAAESIKESLDAKTPAAPLYIRKIAGIVETIRCLHRVQEGLKETAGLGRDLLAASLLDAYRETLTIQKF